MSTAPFSMTPRDLVKSTAVTIPWPSMVPRLFRNAIHAIGQLSVGDYAKHLARSPRHTSVVQGEHWHWRVRCTGHPHQHVLWQGHQQRRPQVLVEVRSFSCVPLFIAETTLNSLYKYAHYENNFSFPLDMLDHENYVYVVDSFRLGNVRPSCAVSSSLQADTLLVH